jgi:hypothetical protein
MITYVKIDKLVGKRPVVVRPNIETGKTEYCFGRNTWRTSVMRAWQAFQDAQRRAEKPAGAECCLEFAGQDPGNVGHAAVPKRRVRIRLKQRLVRPT